MNWAKNRAYFILGPDCRPFLNHCVAAFKCNGVVGSTYIDRYSLIHELGLVLCHQIFLLVAHYLLINPLGIYVSLDSINYSVRQ